MEIDRYDILEKVTWCTSDECKEGLRSWIRLLNPEPNSLFPPEEIRPRQRDLLLSFYRPYINDLKSGLYNTYRMEDRWRVSPVFFDRDNKITDKIYNGVTTSLSSIKYGNPAIVLNRNHHFPDNTQSEILPGLREALMIPSQENVLVNSSVEVLRDQFPYVLCSLNLSSPDSEIIEAVEYLRKVHGMDVPKDKRNRTRGGRPKDTIKIEEYFLAVLIMLQLNISVSEIYEDILKKRPNIALNKRTFQKQIPVLLNFVDPEEIGQKDGKIKSEFID